MKAYVFISEWVIGGDDASDHIELYTTKEQAQARLKADFESAKGVFEMYDEGDLDITQSDDDYIVCVAGDYIENHITGRVLERDIQ